MSEPTDKPVATILLVEDDDIDATLLERALNKQEMKVRLVRAVDGEEALEMLGDDGPDRISGPVVILLDLNLPRMTGLEFLAELRRDTRHFALPVFVFSTSSNPQEIRAAYERNVAAYLVKPVSTGQLDAITELLTTWLRLSRLPIG